jgi:hypothetical protein
VIESRREGLERFLSIVAGHPLLQVWFFFVVVGEKEGLLVFARAAFHDPETYLY